MGGGPGQGLAGSGPTIPWRTTKGVPAVRMDNLIGDQANDWLSLLQDPANHLHLYGKGEINPGRKMGHVTRLLTDGHG